MTWLNDLHCARVEAGAAWPSSCLPASWILCLSSVSILVVRESPALTPCSDGTLFAIGSKRRRTGRGLCGVRVPSAAKGGRLHESPRDWPPWPGGDAVSRSSPSANPTVAVGLELDVISGPSSSAGGSPDRRRNGTRARHRAGGDDHCSVGPPGGAARRRGPRQLGSRADRQAGGIKSCWALGPLDPLAPAVPPASPSRHGRRRRGGPYPEGRLGRAGRPVPILV